MSKCFHHFSLPVSWPLASLPNQSPILLSQPTGLSNTSAVWPSGLEPFLDSSTWARRDVLQPAHRTGISSDFVEIAVYATGLTFPIALSPTVSSRLTMLSVLNGAIQPTSPRGHVEAPQCKDGPSTIYTRETMLRLFMRTSRALRQLPCPVPILSRLADPSPATSGMNAHPMLSTALTATSVPVGTVILSTSPL